MTNFYIAGTEAQRRKKKREFWQICDPLEDEGPPYLPKVYILEDTETTSWQQLGKYSLNPVHIYRHKVTKAQRHKVFVTFILVFLSIFLCAFVPTFINVFTDDLPISLYKIFGRCCPASRYYIFFL